MLKPVTTDIDALKTLDERLRWLSAWTIHHANHIRTSDDGLKVGGHQASCASMTAIMAALYFHALGPNDRVAVKPHAGPVLHAIHYLLGIQSREALENFRGFGGAQAYPSRTKDRIPVDFSTGSVGLGVAITLFASLMQDYLTAHGWLEEAERGRFVALIGDAELDEGNIYEAIIEGAKHDVRNLWWIVDYNRQSLDATSADRMFERFDEIFRSCGWRVVELRYGKRLERALDANTALKGWFEQLSNAELSALHYQGGAAWRKRIEADLGKKAAAFLKEHDDAALASLFTDLGGHCMETLVDAFDAAQDDVPTLFIAWTIKGFGLPFAGHKDNHSGLMNPTQLAALREAWACARARSGRRSKASATMRGPASKRWSSAAASRARSAVEAFGTVAIPHPGAGGRGTIDPGRVRPDPARPVEGRRRPCRPHRHDFARRHRLDQPRRMGEPARVVPPKRNARCLCPGKNRLRTKMGREQQWPAHRARNRREQPVPDARRRRARPATCSERACSPSARSTTRSSPAASIASTTPATRMRVSCSSRRRAESRSGPRAARTSRSTRR